MLCVFIGMIVWFCCLTISCSNLQSHSFFPHTSLQEMTKLRSENEGLKQLRKQMDNEIEELTAALFQEAYKMVNGAHARRAGVEKQLQETQGKVLGPLQLSQSFLEHAYLTNIGSLAPPPTLPNKSMRYTLWI